MIVDRVLYNPHDPARINKIDTVNLGDVLNYPILVGASNPAYRPQLPKDQAAGSLPVEPLPRGLATTVLSKSQETKKRKAAATNLQRVNAERNALSLSSRQSDRLRGVSVNSLEETEAWESMVSELIMDWSMSKDKPTIFAVDIIDPITQPVSPVEPKHHRAAMSTPEAAEWQASEQRELSSLQKNEFAEVVDVPAGRRVL